MLLLAGCTQDETPDASVNSLPPDTYPLQIASVTVAAEADGTQPQTRITDSGNASSWQDGDEIAVSMGGQTAVYSYNSTDKVWTSNAPLYWQNDEPQTVTAWYPVENEIDFTQQDTKGLTYLLKTPDTEATFGSSITLNFVHQLAKVRVVLKGDKTSEVTAVTVRSYPTSAHTQGTLGNLDQSLTTQYVPMLKTQYNGQDCWEATLRDGTLQADNSFKVEAKNGTSVQVVLDENISIKAGKVYTITINVEQTPKEIDLDNVTESQLTVSGKTILKGDGQQKNLQITVEADAEVTLEDVVLAPSATGNAITCNGNATIILTGSSSLTAKTESSSNSYGSGIYVESGTLTIDGEGKLNISRASTDTHGLGPVGAGIGAGSGANILIENGDISISNVPTGGASCGAGIGSLYEGSCGDITIKGGTISIGQPSWYSACIGSAQSGSCGNITISGESTVITFTKGQHAPWGIGNGEGGTCGTVTITGGATVNGKKYYDHTGTL